MKTSEIDALLQELKLSKTGIEWTIKGDEAQITVNEIIKKHISESETLQNISILEAKIFVYEEIISKSNFAPMIKPKNKKK
jgi:hypothetical protein